MKEEPVRTPKYHCSFSSEKNKAKKEGGAPIYLRITLDGKRFETATINWQTQTTGITKLND
jgi:hypothetical protein